MLSSSFVSFPTNLQTRQSTADLPAQHPVELVVSQSCFRKSHRRPAARKPCDQPEKIIELGDVGGELRLLGPSTPACTWPTAGNMGRDALTRSPVQAILYCIILKYIILHDTILYCTILYSTLFYSTILQVKQCSEGQNYPGMWPSLVSVVMPPASAWHQHRPQLAHKT